MALTAPGPRWGSRPSSSVPSRLVKRIRNLATPRLRKGPRYLIFDEGYAATAGERWIPPDPVEEARLARILADLLPSEPESTASSR